MKFHFSLFYSAVLLGSTVSAVELSAKHALRGSTEATGSAMLAPNMQHVPAPAASDTSNEGRRLDIFDDFSFEELGVVSDWFHAAVCGAGSDQKGVQVGAANGARAMAGSMGMLLPATAVATKSVLTKIPIMTFVFTAAFAFAEVGLCTGDTATPFNDVVNYMIKYVDERLAEDNLNDELIDLASLLNNNFSSKVAEYMEELSYHGSGLRDKMKSITDTADDIKIALFESDSKYTNNPEHYGIDGPEDWRSLTFQLAQLFALQHTAVLIERLANYEVMYGQGALSNSNLLLNYEYNNVLDAVAEYREYFTSSDTERMLREWRTNQYQIDETYHKSTGTCPKDPDEATCGLKSGCRCINEYEIADVYGGYYKHSGDKVGFASQICFSERYRNLGGQMRNDFGSANCASSLHHINDIVENQVDNWMNLVKDDELWERQEMNSQFQLDNVLGYQLRNEASATCLSTDASEPSGTSSASMEPCVWDSADQQWEIRGKMTVTIGLGLVAGDDGSLEYSRGESGMNSRWFLEPVVDQVNTYYIRSNGDWSKAVGAYKPVDGYDYLQPILDDFDELNPYQKWTIHFEEEMIRVASDETKCLAAAKRGTDLKTIDCDSIDAAFGQYFKVEDFNEYDFVVAQRGTDKLLVPDGAKVVASSADISYDQARWEFTTKGNLRHIGTGSIFTTYNSGVILLTSVEKTPLVRFPTMLEFEPSTNPPTAAPLAGTTSQSAFLLRNDDYDKCIEATTDGKIESKPCDESVDGQMWAVRPFGYNYRFLQLQTGLALTNVPDSYSFEAQIEDTSDDTQLWRVTNQKKLENIGASGDFKYLSVFGSGSLYMTSSESRAKSFVPTEIFN